MVCPALYGSQELYSVGIDQKMARLKRISKVFPWTFETLLEDNRDARRRRPSDFFPIKSVRRTFYSLAGLAGELLTKIQTNISVSMPSMSWTLEVTPPFEKSAIFVSCDGKYLMGANSSSRKAES